MGISGARLGILLLALVGLAVPVSADAVRKERVQFGTGETSTMVEGSVSGYDSVEYQVGASAGQQMTVVLEAKNPQAYFNIFAPGQVPGEGTALFVGPREGLSFNGKAKQSGDYTIQVFLMRAAARRAESAAYALHVGITGAAAQAATPASAPGPLFVDGPASGPDVWQVAGVGAGDALKLRTDPSSRAAELGEFANGTQLRNLGCEMQGAQRWCQVETVEGPPQHGWVAARYLQAVAPSGDAKVPGTDDHATGDLNCATEAGQPTAPCHYGVTRAEGKATVIVVLPGGGTRTLFFAGGLATGSNSDAPFTATREKDLSLIRVGTERYEVPDAIVLGG